jgi:hypothetical protein
MLVGVCQFSSDVAWMSFSSNSSFWNLAFLWLAQPYRMLAVSVSLPSIPDLLICDYFIIQVIPDNAGANQSANTVLLVNIPTNYH